MSYKIINTGLHFHGQESGMLQQFLQVVLRYDIMCLFVFIDGTI